MSKDFTREEIEDMRVKMGWPDDTPDFALTNILHRQELKRNADDTRDMILKMEGNLLLSDPLRLARCFSIIEGRLHFLENRVSELENANKKLRDAFN